MRLVIALDVFSWPHPPVATSPKFSSALASVSFKVGPDFGLFSVSCRPVSTDVFLCRPDSISPVINLQHIYRKRISAHCPLTCRLSPPSAGGAVMLLVYEYVSGWLQRNW